jgi:hypothetical protein
MALFSLSVRCGDLGSFVAQFHGTSAYDAVGALLKRGLLRDITAKAPEWPQDFSLRDVYVFIPLEGLPNAYHCGLGARGKYVEISLFQTVQRSAMAERYCGPKKKVVTLR